VRRCGVDGRRGVKPIGSFIGTGGRREIPSFEVSLPLL